MGLEAMGAGLKVRIATIADIKRVYAPNELPDSVNQFPSALILPGSVEYDVTMGGMGNITFRLVILLSKQDQPTALNRILDYVDPTGSDSVPAAVDGDPTLNSTCDTSRVISNSGVGVTNWGGIPYLSTEFEIEVYG